LSHISDGVLPWFDFWGWHSWKDFLHGHWLRLFGDLDSVPLVPLWLECLALHLGNPLVNLRISVSKANSIDESVISDEADDLLVGFQAE